MLPGARGKQPIRNVAGGLALRPCPDTWSSESGGKEGAM